MGILVAHYGLHLMPLSDNLKARGIHAGLIPELYSHLLNVQLVESREFNVGSSEFKLSSCSFVQHILVKLQMTLGSCVVSSYYPCVSTFFFFFLEDVAKVLGFEYLCSSLNVGKQLYIFILGLTFYLAM